MVKPLCMWRNRTESFLSISFYVFRGITRLTSVLLGHKKAHVTRGILSYLLEVKHFRKLLVKHLLASFG